jgi:CheY-like chemotaxis protein
MRNVANISRKTLMVVEDDSEMRAMLSELLFHCGYSVFASDDVRGACDLARELNPAAIICDVVMPTMSGFEAADCLRNDPSTSKIPLIFMTGHSYLRDRRSCEARWLFKPFTQDQLAATLAQTVQ